MTDLEQLEDADPTVVHFAVEGVDEYGRAVMVPVFGWRVGHFVVRQSSAGERGISLSTSQTTASGFVVHYLPDGSDVADPVAVVLAGRNAEACAWWIADELSRHLLVDEQGFHASVSAWPGLQHLWEQRKRIVQGEVPVPWHHTDDGYIGLRLRQRRMLAECELNQDEVRACT